MLLMLHVLHARYLRACMPCSYRSPVAFAFESLSMFARSTAHATCHTPHAPPRIVQAAGDALLLDLRAFHFGTANRSDCARVQLSATFREPTAPDVDDALGDNARGGDYDGFTYELREELVGRRTLGDFLP